MKVHSAQKNICDTILFSFPLDLEKCEKILKVLSENVSHLLTPCYDLTPCCVLLTLYSDGLQMLLNTSIACWYFPLVDNLREYKF